MVILITGASHTGKTLLAQRLVEKYGYSCCSIDLLKMGLIRSGQHGSDTRRCSTRNWKIYLAADIFGK